MPTRSSRATDASSEVRSAPSEPSAPRNGAVRWIIYLAAASTYAIPALWALRNYVQLPYDLGIYDQTLWLLWNGEFFNTITGLHVFGAHFSPILFLFSPLSALPGGAAPEIVVQSLLIAAGIFPAYLLADKSGRSPYWFVALYALHPGIISGSWYGFRGWNLAVAPFMWAVYLIWSKPTPTRIVFAGLIGLLFREDLALWVGLAAVILFLGGQIKLRALVISGIGLAIPTAIVVLGVLPELSSTGEYFFTSPGGGAATPVTTAALLTLGRVIYLLVPVGLAITKIRWVLVAPLAIPLLGLMWQGGNALRTFYHYEMMFVPLLLLVLSLSPHARGRARSTVALSFLVLFALGAMRPIPPFAGSNPFSVNFSVTRYLDDTMDVVNRVDPTHQASISVPSLLVPQLSERRHVFIFPSPIDPHEGDASFSDLRDRVTFDCPAPEIVVRDIRANVKEWPGILRDEYRLVADMGTLEVWTRTDETDDGPCSATWTQ